MSEYGYMGTDTEIDHTNMLKAVLKKRKIPRRDPNDETLNMLEKQINLLSDKTEKKFGFVDNDKIVIQRVDNFIEEDGAKPFNEKADPLGGVSTAFKNVKSRHEDLMGSQSGGKRKKRSKSRRKNKKSRKSVKSRKSQKKRKSRKRMKTRKKRK